MRWSFPRAPRGCLLLALLLLNALLLTPELPWAGFPTVHWLALEAPLAVGLLALLNPGALRRGLSALVALAAVAVSLGAAGDALTQTLQGRSLNLYTDIGLIPIFIELLVANLGLALTLAGLVAIGLSLFALGYGLHRLLQGFHRRNVPVSLALCLVLVGGAGLARIDALQRHDDAAWLARLGHPAVSFVGFEWQRAQQTRQALAEFGRQLEQGAPAAPLPGLADTDVILGFIESYGVAAIERAPFAAPIQARLRTLQSQLQSAGLSVVTGRLTASTLGGQSWLNHATFLSGLPITSQLRFELMLNRRAPTLIDDFAATGLETRAFMPGIHRDWLEGRRQGYDVIHAADDLQYRGPSMGWASMPDQFVWQRIGEQALTPAAHPGFNVLATLSSHAPWSPVIDLVPWSEIGDGEVFARWQDAGEIDAALWQDRDAMRRQYAPAIDYALQAAGGFAERYVDDRTLLMILGDHQAAPSIIGEAPGKDVPIHVISADPALLEGFIAAGFRPGMLPPAAGHAIPMAAMRGWLHRWFGESSTKTDRPRSRPDSARETGRPNTASVGDVATLDQAGDRGDDQDAEDDRHR